MLSEVFERKVWRVQVANGEQAAHLHNAAHAHFQVRGSVFNCEQMLTKTSFVIFDIVVKKQIQCGLAWPVLLSTTIRVITVVCCETIFCSDTSTERETAIFKICPPAARWL